MELADMLVITKADGDNLLQTKLDKNTKIFTLISSYGK